MLVSAVVNSTLNQSLGRMLKKNNFASFAFRSYVSTGVGQFIDNLVFAIVVSHTFFGWTWVQVLMCSLTGAVAELLCEVFLSPVGYRSCAAGSARMWVPSTSSATQPPKEQSMRVLITGASGGIGAACVQRFWTRPRGRGL